VPQLQLRLDSEEIQKSALIDAPLLRSILTNFTMWDSLASTFNGGGYDVLS
jgi:hypothetical protein